MKHVFYLSILFVGLSLKSLAQSTADEKIIAFSKLYSTIKFYYPEPNLINFPWHALAYKGYQLALENENDEVFINKSKALFQTIAPGVQINKKNVFDMRKITPANPRAYPTTKFWQHKIALNVNKKQVFATTSLNYIYQQKNIKYQLVQLFNPKQKGMLGKKIKVSFWAKWEGAIDTSLAFFQLMPYNRKTKTFLDYTIKVNKNEWALYTQEIDYPEDISVDKLNFNFPSSGTIYVDDLQIEKYENNLWQKINFNNTGFESYSPLGSLVGWEDPFIGGSIVEKNNSAVKEGKFSLKLSSVQDQILYQPRDIENPFEIKLIGDYHAFVPLQVFANDTSIYPSSNKKELEQFAIQLKAQVDSNAPMNQQRIAMAIEIWSQLYHDYPYRENNFNEKNNYFLLCFLHALEKSTVDFNPNDIYIKYISWLNDPHATIAYRSLVKEPRKKFRIPINIALTQHECVVSNIKKAGSVIEPGDVVLKINNVAIDSLIKEYNRFSIAKINQQLAISKLLEIFDADSTEVIVNRNNKIWKEVFTSKNQTIAQAPSTQSATDSLNEENEEQQYKNDIEQKMKSGQVYYYQENTVGSKNKPMQITEDKVDSLVKIFNNYQYVMIDLRGKANNAFLNYLDTHIPTIDLDKKLNVVKKTFQPVADFKYDTVSYLQQSKSQLVLKPKIVYLVNYRTMGSVELNLVRSKYGKYGIFIGENTAGATGIINKIRIYDDVEFYYSSSKNIGLSDLQNGNYQSVGLKPDYVVYPTKEGIKENRDEVLDKALEVIKNLK
jgi:hypothetical protein